MERITKAMLVIIALLVAVSVEVEGARMLNSNNAGQQVVQPQTFYGGVVGGSIPGPGFSGVGFGPNGFYAFPGSGGSIGSGGMDGSGSDGPVTGLPSISSPPSNGIINP